MVKKWLDGAKASASITVLASMAVFVVAQPAQAGFEWSPPPAKQSSPVAAAPAPAVEAEFLDAPVPMPALETVPSRTSATNMRRAAPAPVMRPAAPLAPAQTTNVPSPAMAEPVPSVPSPEFAPAVGFGSDIPLVLAMRQIVPPDYSYSFDLGVNQGERISWSGGKPWDEALADAVRPLGLEVFVVGNVVWLRHGTVDMDEKIRISDVEPMPEPIAASSPMPVPMQMQAPEQMVPRAPVVDTAPKPMPLSVSKSASAEMQEPVQQSYPRRQRPVMDRAEMAVAKDSDNAVKAPAAPAPTAAYTTDYSNGPVPLMKALPPAPQEPVAAVQKPAALDQATGRGPVMDPLEIRFWQAEQGSSLKEVLNRWASSANVAMLWNSPYDYALPAPMSMHGTFPDAVTNILMTYGMADPRPLGRLHPNLPGGPSVLVIENYTEKTN